MLDDSHPRWLALSAVNFHVRQSLSDGPVHAGATDAELVSYGRTAVAFSVKVEASTWSMMILGFAGVGYMAYRRKRQKTALPKAKISFFWKSRRKAAFLLKVTS